MAAPHFNHVIVSPVGKSGGAPSVDLEVGDSGHQADGRQRPDRRARRPDGRPLREAHLDHAGWQPVQALSHLADPRDRQLRRGLQHLPAGGTGEDRLEKYIADNLLPWAAGDFAPEEAGVIDEDTYVEQGRDLERAYSLQVINFILGTLQPDTDLAMVGYPFTDEVSHQFMGLVSPTDADGNPNPCYDVNPKFDDVQCTGRGTAGRVADREEYIRSAYADADEKLGVAREPDGWQPDDLRRVRPWLRAGLLRGQRQRRAEPGDGDVARRRRPRRRRLAQREQRHRPELQQPHRSPTIDDIAKACWAGGTIQIYINPPGSAAHPTADPSWPTYAEVRAAIGRLRGPHRPGASGQARWSSKIMDKEELRDVDGSDSLHPNRSGDVVVVTRPPYQSDAGTDDVRHLAVPLLRPARLPAEHGRPREQHQHACARSSCSGPGIKHQRRRSRISGRSTSPRHSSSLMGIPGPQNARGRHPLRHPQGRRRPP